MQGLVLDSAVPLYGGAVEIIKVRPLEPGLNWVILNVTIFFWQALTLLSAMKFLYNTQNLISPW